MLTPGAALQSSSAQLLIRLERRGANYAAGMMAGAFGRADGAWYAGYSSAQRPETGRYRLQRTPRRPAAPPRGEHVEAEVMTEALAALNTAHQARLGELHGGSVALDYGDFAGEVQALREGVGVLALEACGFIMVRGPEAATFLTGITTNDVAALAEGAAQPDLMCANKGKILFPLDVVRLSAEQYLVITEPGQLDRVAAHMDAYHIREDAEIGMVPLVRLDLIGPAAEAALTALGHDPDQPRGRFNEQPVFTVRYPLGTSPRMMVVLPGAVAADWLQALLGAHPGARLAGFEAYDEVRIWAGVPRFGADFGEENLPAEAALYDRLNFRKGCYVGQEVHARLHYRGRVNQKLMAVDMPDATAETLAPGQELYRDGHTVGVLTSLARLAREGRRRGIAITRSKYIEPEVALATAPDAEGIMQVAPLATDLGQRRA